MIQKVTPELVDRYWELTLREWEIGAAFVARLNQNTTMDDHWKICIPSRFLC